MNTRLLTQLTSIAIVTALLGGCASSNTGYTTTTDTTNSGPNRNTVIGAGTGAALGGALGAAVSKNGKKNEGALIGAAIGGLVGGLVGNNYGNQINNILNGTGSTSTTLPDGSVKINLAGDLSFNSGSAIIRDSFVSTLDKVAKTIASSPNSRVVVVGHTDSTGNADANQQLSIARANSVRDFLTSSGVSPSRITAYGRGSTQPIASNDTEAGRAQNRRVEVFIYPN